MHDCHTADDVDRTGLTCSIIIDRLDALKPNAFARARFNLDITVRQAENKLKTQFVDIFCRAEKRHRLHRQKLKSAEYKMNKK